MINILLGIILVGVVIVFMAGSAAFRNFVFVILGVVGLGILAIILTAQNNQAQYEKKQAAENQAKALLQQQLQAALSTGLIKVDDVQLAPEGYGRRDEFVLKGTVTNGSKSGINDLYFEVIVTDCAVSGCIVVGQQTTEAAIQVPSGQKRSFSSWAISFPGLPAAGSSQRSWKYRLTSASSN